MAPQASNKPGGLYLHPDKQTYLSRLRHQLGALDYLLYPITEEQMRQRAIEDKWSVFENLAHLARYQEVLDGRVEIILQQDFPVFDRYVADNDPGFHTWVSKSFPVLTHAMRTKRNAIAKKVAGLQDVELQRVGVHPAYGRLNISGWIEFFLLHEAHHIFTIFKLTSSFRL